MVGGGIVGLSCAIALAERGHRVTLCDPGLSRQRASFGNAGVISRGSIFALAAPGIWKNLPRYGANRDVALRIDWRNAWRILPWFTHFLRAANETQWRRSAAALDPLTAKAFAEHERLAALAGAQALIAHEGWLRLYRTEDAFAQSALERAVLAEHAIETRVLDSAALRDFEPALTRAYARAVYFPQTGAVRDPGALVAAYERLALTLGVTFRREKVEDMGLESETWRLRTALGVLAADKVVLATGVWSHGMTRRLGYRFPLAAERGYHREFRPGAGPALRRPIHDTGGSFIVSPMGGDDAPRLRVLCGVDLSPRDAPEKHAQIDAVTMDAATTLPLGAPIDNAPWMGFRPSTPDGLPIIGAAPRHVGLFFAFGHGHIGLSNGPITGRIVADLLEGRPPPVPIEAFAPARFA